LTYDKFKKNSFILKFINYLKGKDFYSKRFFESAIKTDGIWKVHHKVKEVENPWLNIQYSKITEVFYRETMPSPFFPNQKPKIF